MVIIGNDTGNDYGTSDSGPHAVLTADDVDYTYDDVGNMVTATDASANTTTYGYDDLYHLTGVDFPTGDDLAMVYDADGTRVSRTEGDTTITYVGGLFEVEDDGVTTTLRTHYTFGGDHIAVRVDDGSTDTLTYQFGDHLGSVAATYEAGTAGTTNRYLHYYYPYGEPRGTQTVFPSDHTYTGQIDDPGGLMYYQARYYQPAIGRFTQPDTIAPDPGNSQDYNRYMYVRGNPVGLSDPSGHAPWVNTAIRPTGELGLLLKPPPKAGSERPRSPSDRGTIALDYTYDFMHGLADSVDGSWGYWGSPGEGLPVVTDFDFLAAANSAFKGNLAKRLCAVECFAPESGGDYYVPFGVAGEEWFYDVFGNVAAGYTFAAGGIDPDTLNGLAPLVPGDDNSPVDRMAVELGAQLWEDYGLNLSVEALGEAIFSMRDDILSVPGQRFIIRGGNGI